MSKIKPKDIALETSLLKNMSVAETYTKYIKNIDHKRILPNTSLLLMDYGKYFQTFPTHKEIDFGEFYTKFANEWHAKDLDQQDIEYYRDYVFPAVQAKELSDPRENFQWLLKKQHVEAIDTLLQNGADMSKIRDLIDTYEKSLSGFTEENLDKEAHTIDRINFADLDKANGIPWFLPSLQSSLMSLTGGQFCIVSADFGTGKSAFVISQLAHTLKWAKRTGEKRPIMFVNSEGMACDVFARMLSCLYRDQVPGGFEEIVERSDEIKSKYLETFRASQVMVFQMSEVSNFKAVQDKMAKYDPCLVIIDICDKLAPEEDVQNLKKLYDNLRVQSGLGCPIIGTSQSGNTSYFDQEKKEVKNKKWLDDHSLYGSITGKGGSADLIITIGREGGTSPLRYIATPKKKRGKEVRITAELQDKFSFYKELQY